MTLDWPSGHEGWWARVEGQKFMSNLQFYLNIFKKMMQISSRLFYILYEYKVYTYFDVLKYLNLVELRIPDLRFFWPDIGQYIIWEIYYLCQHLKFAKKDMKKDFKNVNFLGQGE